MCVCVWGGGGGGGGGGVNSVAVYCLDMFFCNIQSVRHLF